MDDILKIDAAVETELATAKWLSCAMKRKNIVIHSRMAIQATSKLSKEYNSYGCEEDEPEIVEMSTSKSAVRTTTPIVNNVALSPADIIAVAQTAALIENYPKVSSDSNSVQATNDGVQATNDGVQATNSDVQETNNDVQANETVTAEGTSNSSTANIQINSDAVDVTLFTAPTTVRSVPTIITIPPNASDVAQHQIAQSVDNDLIITTTEKPTTTRRRRRPIRPTGIRPPSIRDFFVRILKRMQPFLTRIGLIAP